MRPHTSRKNATTALGRLQRFGADQGGASLVIAAIMFPVVIGGMGLGAETGYWYLTQRKLQHIADVSVHAAGARQRAGDTKVKIEAAAQHVASRSGLPASATLTVNIPPASGAFAGDPDSVEVIATDTQALLFSAVVQNFFSNDPKTTVTISGRAVARVTATGSTACVLALSNTAARAVNVDGSSIVDLEGCDVASNSNAADSLHATSSLKTGCAYAVGRAVTPALTLTVCANVKENAPMVRDPYAAVAEPSAAGLPCESSDKVGKPNEPTTITPIHNHASGLKAMRFCTGLDAKGPVTFGPGLYFIEGGDFKMTSSNLASQLSGSGAIFHFSATGRLQIAGAVTNFAAPIDGPFSGLLFFASRSTPAAINHQLGGNPLSTMNGAIYAPSSAIQVAGNAKATGGCTQVIGSTVRITGTSTLQSSCENAGTSPIDTNEVVKIVE